MWVIGLPGMSVWLHGFCTVGPVVCWCGQWMGRMAA